MVKNLTHTFLETLDKHAPVKKKRIKHHVQPTWFNKDTKERIIYRDRAKQKMDHNNYRILQNMVENMIKKAKSRLYHSIICKSKGNSKLLWQQMRELTGKKADKGPQTILIHDQMCNDANIIANELNTYFAHVDDDILSTQVQLAPSENYEAHECLREFVASKLPEGVEFNIPTVTEAQ